MSVLSYTDPDFGPISWQAWSSTWVGRLSVGSDKVAEFSIFAEPHHMEISAEARATFLFVRRSDQAARQFASDQLLGLYNDDWNEGERLNPTQFMARLRLEGLDVDEEAGATLYYFSDDMFSDHSIQISANAKGEFTYATI